MELLQLLVILMAGHLLADYPLQSDAIATGKNRNIDPCKFGVPYYYWLSSHAATHALVVGYITGSVMLGLIEFFAHYIIDFSKCEKWFGLHTDQLLHLLCKVLYIVILAINK